MSSTKDMRNWFMLPHPIHNTYAAPLPFQTNKQQLVLYSYYSGKNSPPQWRENILSDKIRQWIEECDSVRAFQISVDCNQSYFAGLATSVLRELSDECK